MKTLDIISEKINQLLMGDFSERMPISDKHDESDAVVVGLNMLGEHLEKTTVSIDKYMDSEKSLDEMVNKLSERVKEMECLQNITQVLLSRSLSFEKTVSKVINMIPRGWGVPEETCARISFEDYSFTTSKFLETQWQQKYVDRNETITVEVFLMESPKKDSGDYPFKPEKVELLNLIGMQLVEAMQHNSSQNQLVAAKDEAITANKAKSEFLSSMSHELRTPLNAIIGFGEILEMTVEDDSIKSSVTQITKAGDHLLSLINDILDLSSIEAGKLTLSIESVPLREVIVECLRLMLPLAEKRDIQIFSSEIQNSQHMLLADYIRLKQVFLNLLSNAIKYNNQGGKIVIASEAQAENKLRITISDTGKGISSESMQELFQEFNRLGAQTTNVEGTGIGLVITKRLVELMGGVIGVESKEGKGTSFWVEFKQAENNNIVDIEENSALLENEIQEPVEDKKTILYIEDNPANLQLVSMIVEKFTSHELISAHDGWLGMELAELHKPDLILLDINLPEINGHEVLKKLKGKNKTKDITVIAVSANAMNKDIKQGKEAGFDDYITKPIVVKKFLEAIQKTLD